MYNTMNEVFDIDFFKKALAEEGMTDVTVLTHRDSYAMGEVILVEKTVNGERISIENKVSDRMLMESDNPKKHMARIALDIARQFQEVITERREWGDQRVMIDIKDELTATCYLCDTKVSMDDLRSGGILMSETATPRPLSLSFKNLPPVKKRMTLLALLRDKCEPTCPNSPANRNL